MTVRCGIELEILEIIQEQSALRAEYELIMWKQFWSGKLGINCCQNSLDCDYLAADFEADIKDLKKVMCPFSWRFIFFLPVFRVEKEMVATVHYWMMVIQAEAVQILICLETTVIWFKSVMYKSF